MKRKLVITILCISIAIISIIALGNKSGNDTDVIENNTEINTEITEQNELTETTEVVELDTHEAGQGYILAISHQNRKQLRMQHFERIMRQGCLV